MKLESHVRPRRVTLERSFNFRDLGGYAATDYRTVRWGLIYRADGIHRIEGADLARVSALGIRTVLDLRTRGELLDHVRVADDAIAQAFRGDAVEFLAGRYLDMLDQGASSIVTALAAMADAEQLPLVFHCSAGKDRTGVLAAILLSVLGVSDDDIAADYALSRAAMRELGEWERTARPDSFATTAALPPTLLDAPPRAMRQFLGRARARHGSLADYVRSVGLTGLQVDALRAALLTV